MKQEHKFIIVKDQDALLIRHSRMVRLIFAQTFAQRGSLFFALCADLRVPESKESFRTLAEKSSLDSCATTDLDFSRPEGIRLLYPRLSEAICRCSKALRRKVLQELRLDLISQARKRTGRQAKNKPISASSKLPPVSKTEAIVAGKGGASQGKWKVEK
jgi:hypothetical protein